MKNIEWRATLGNHDYYGGYDSIEAQLERTRYDKNWYLPNESYYYRDVETNSYFIHIDTCKIYPELYHETDLMISKRQISETLEYLEFALKEQQNIKQIGYLYLDIIIFFQMDIIKIMKLWKKDYCRCY